LITAALAAMPLIEQAGQGLASTITHDLAGLFSAFKGAHAGQKSPSSASSASASSAASAASSAAATLPGGLGAGLGGGVMNALLAFQQVGSQLTSFDPASAAAKAIASADTNSDGTLSKTEFETGLQNLLGHHAGPAGASSALTGLADKMFAKVDSNSDGQVSAAELTSYLGSAQQKAAAAYQSVDSLLTGLLGQASSALGSVAKTATTV
jgi:hypothetical protein